MSVDPDLPQDPGIPGTKSPEELPPQSEPEVDDVPDADQPDATTKATWPLNSAMHC